MIDLICGVDPGGTTGLILCSPRGEILDSSEASRIPEVAGQIREWSPDVLVVENFIPNRKVDNTALKVIGAVELLSEDMDIPMHLQSPSVLARFKTKDAGGSPHINSALSHVRHWIFREVNRGNIRPTIGGRESKTQ